MTQKDNSESMDQKPLDEEKKMKSSPIINALLIGFMVGVVVYGVAKNNLGFFALIPLFLAFRIFNKPNKHQA